MPKDIICSIDGCDRPIVNGRGWCRRHYARWARHGDPEAGGLLRKEKTQGFLKQATSYDGEDCLIWPYARLKNGHAVINIGGKVKIVSRLVCESANGQPPSPKHEAAHSCGNGHLGCIAPKHLRWATRLENERDKFIHGTTNRGERSPMAKLTECSVREIRKRLDAGIRMAQVAREFGISPSAVLNVKTGRNWWFVT